MKKKTERELEEEFTESLSNSLFKKEKATLEDAIGEALKRTTKDRPGDPRDEKEANHRTNRPEWI